MSLARFGSLGDVIGRRKSVDEPTEKSNTPSQEQDYVLVDDSENGDSERDGSKDDKVRPWSKEHTSLGLDVTSCEQHRSLTCHVEAFPSDSHM